MKFQTRCLVLFFISFPMKMSSFTCAENIGILSGYINFGLAVGFDLDQAFIDLAAQKYPIMRTIHSKPPSNLIPLVVLVNDIAKSLNCTVRAISYFTLKDPNDTLLNSPTIIFSIYLTDKQVFDQTWILYWNRNINFTVGQKNLPSVLLTEALHLNFVYCGVIHSKFESPFRLGIFTTSFDIYCWISLICSFGMVVVCIYLQTRNSLISVVLILLSTLLTPGISGLTKETKKLVMQVVWMLSCIVLTNLYLGEFTSMLVKPSEPNVLENVRQLRENNFTLLYPTHSYYKSIRNAAVKKESPFKILNIEVVSDNIINLEDKELKFIEILTSKNSKQAFIHFWTLAIHFADIAKEYLGKQKVKSAVTCHVGKTLIQVNSFNYLILPPNNDIVFRVYQNFFDSGIYRRWEDETIGLSISSRIQDRAKVRSPTKLVDDDLTVTSLKLERRMSKLFLLWAICLAVCLVAFVCEWKFKPTGFSTEVIIW